MAEFKLGRIRFVWKNNWTTGVTYVKDDIVRNGGKTYLCVLGHTAAADFYTDLTHSPTRWNQVSDGTEWKGSWTTNFYYKVNDLVKYGGRIYLCNLAHTSNASANSGTSPDITAGLEADLTKWDVYATSFDWKGDWETSTRYKIDDIVRYGGISYVCNTGHQSAATVSTDSDGLEHDLSKWDVYATGFQWIGDWTTGHRYVKNDVVLYGGTTYVCNTGHQSAATATLGLEVDQGLWDYFHKGIKFLGEWSGSAVRYKVNDIVKYGADLWICTLDHTSASLFSDSTNWSLFVNGLQFESSWSDAAVYQPGDIVSYGGYAYIAKTNHTNKIPTQNLSDWDLFTTGFNFRGDWELTSDYRVGDVIRLNGYTYVSLLDHTSDNVNLPPNLTYWSRLNSGIKWAATTQLFANVGGTNIVGTGSGAKFDVTLSNTGYTAVVHTGSAGTGYVTNDTIKITGDLIGGVTPANDVTLTVTASGGNVQTVTASGIAVTWASGTSYVLGDAVLFGVNSYICILAHVGGPSSRPDSDVTGTYWNLLSQGSITSVLTTQGDTIYYGGSGPTRLPIGTDGQVLRVTGNKPSWEYFGVINNVVYVANNGADVIGAGQGLTVDKPWKSVRFAAKQIEDGYLNPNAARLIASNKQFLIKEINNFIQYTNSVSVSAASTTVFTATSTAGIYVGMPISFTGTLGGVTAGTTYYVYDIVGNTFGISNTSATPTRRTLTAGSGSMTGSYVYVPAKAERDAGIIVDALVYDISHSGTYQTTQAALAYFNSAGNAYVSGVYSYDITAFVGALNYLTVLVGNVLANAAPAQNYQTLNSVALANQAIQNIDVTKISESSTATITTNLISIVTTGLSAGTTSAIPAVVNPGTTISVKTGTYTEVLPIVVPRNTAVVGDELRSSVVKPAVANTNLVNDKPKTISVLNRIKAIVPDLLANNSVTPTDGNTSPQLYLNGFAGSATAISRINTNTGVINTILAGGLAAVPSTTITDPSGYDTGYFNARRLIVANKQFLKDEVTAFMATGPYSTLWGNLTAGQKTACTRDIGYIVDALQYDLTYGGNLETVVAARSYYSNGTFVENSNEKTAALAVQAHIKSIIDEISKGIAITPSSGNVTPQDTSGTGGSPAAALFAQDRIQEIYNTISSGYTPTVIAPSTSWVASDLVAASAVIQSKKAVIQSGAIAAINRQYPTLVYNTATCSRDVGYMIDALCYDVMFNSNFRSIKTGMSYYRATSSAQVVINNQLTQSEYVVNYINTTLQHLAQGVIGDAGSTSATNSVLTSTSVINTILVNGITTVPAFTFTNPTGYNTTFLESYGDGKAQIVQNYQFIKDEISAWMALPANGYNTVWAAIGAGGQANCTRDVGYILDALQYDMTYGGNTQSLIAGSAFYSNGALVEYMTGEKAAAIAAYGRLQTIIGQIVQKQLVTPTSGNTTPQVTTGSVGANIAAAATFAQARVGDVISWITNATAPTAIAPTAAIALASTALQNGYTALQAAKTEIQADTVAWVNKFYQAVNFNSVTCSRDAGLIVDALSYDLVFGTNFNSIKAGMAYYRATTSAAYVITNQLAAEIGSVNFIGQKAKRIAAHGASAQIIANIDDMIASIIGTVTTSATATAVGGDITVNSSANLYVGMPIKFGASVGGLTTGQTYWVASIPNTTTITVSSVCGSTTPITLTNQSGITISVTAGSQYEYCGTNTYNNVLSTINGAEILRANTTFLANEATAWVAHTYAAAVTSTAASTGRLTTTAPHPFTIGDPVVFAGTTFGNITANLVYYVLDVPTTNTITLTSNQGSTTPVTLQDASGAMTVEYSFSASACQRDMAAYVDALAYDINYLGNYKSLRATQLYKNSVSGSLLSDMFYLRNSTGLRNMTLSGLTGDLSTANSYGTKRPTAGAYASLDPGYGPTDNNVWISTRSPYVQNVTNFGTGCVGCKIDGALHVGGNRSIVANDFTQILSDGIGVWCTGHNSLTELVSVFTYYNYAGYLAEYGGKIRATNGNNSYGTYGSLAEGVDTYEVPITGTINNRYYEAQIANVLTDSTNNIYRFEYSNAGNGYNTATYSISGTGYNAATVSNEFRDNAVFETALLTNGANYATISNVAQGGSTTSITIAATDSAISAAYIGMRILLLGGTGVGQTGYFLTYNSGTKSGTVAKESFAPLTVTSAGSNLLTVASTATLYANMPIQFTGSVLTGCTLSTGTTYYVVGASITATQFSVSTGSGGVAISVGTSSGGGPMLVNAVGWDHVLPGTAIASFLDLTTSYVIEPRVTFTSPTFSATAGTITSSAYTDVVYGDTSVTYNGVGSAGVDSTGGSGSGATFTVTRSGVAYSVITNNTGTGYKYGDVLKIVGTSLGGATTANDITITVNNVNSTTGAIQNFTYTGTGAGGYYVAITDGSSATQISSNGTTFASGGALTGTAWSAIAYGAGRWIAIAKTGTAASAYTTDPTVAWTAGGTLPATPGSWAAVCYGNGAFMAVSAGSTLAASSTNGVSWTATAALPASTTWTGVTYGNGVYVAVASGGTQAATSTDGISWTTRSLPTSANWSSVTFGKGVFVAVATGSNITAYSKDGINWIQPNAGLPASSTWSKVRYGNGVFAAITSGATALLASSENGKDWTARTLATTQAWSGIAYGNPSSTPLWVCLGTSTTVSNYLNLGCTAQARVKVSNGAVSEVRIVEPGSGYVAAPIMTLTDPNVTLAATWTVRTGTGVLANPTFSNRGLQYATATATVDGNGYGDVFQTGYYINVSGLLSQPTAGSNIQIAGNNTYYKLVQVTNYLGTSGNGAGGSSPYTARFQISPALTSVNTPAHGAALTMRIKYSQVRLTGHDFLSIGTGGVTTTNYPNTPTQLADANKQTVGNGGGRTFYTATDQDGNFTVGTLFSVQQATGVASINADAFNLAGLNSLTLGSVALGGTGATVTQFSTDQYFTANSDNIVPTQKAIKSYISSQIGGGSSALNVNTLTAGVIYIAGNSMSTTTGVQINVTATMNFTGGINGLPVAMDFLLLG